MFNKLHHSLTCLHSVALEQQKFYNFITAFFSLFVVCLLFLLSALLKGKTPQAALHLWSPASYTGLGTVHEDCTTLSWFVAGKMWTPQEMWATVIKYRFLNEILASRVFALKRGRRLCPDPLQQVHGIIWCHEMQRFLIHSQSSTFSQSVPQARPELWSCCWAVVIAIDAVDSCACILNTSCRQASFDFTPIPPPNKNNMPAWSNTSFGDNPVKWKPVWVEATSDRR